VSNKRRISAEEVQQVGRHVRRLDGSPLYSRQDPGLASSTAIVITGSLAEIAAGSIAMGLSGYLAAWRGQRIK